MADKCNQCGREFSSQQTASSSEKDGICADCRHAAAAKADAKSTGEQSRTGFFSRENNTVGLIGFIASLWCIIPNFWLLFPVAFIISVAGLRKKPRTLAIAGCVICGLLPASGVVAFFCTFFNTR